MKRYLIILLWGSLFAQQAALAQGFHPRGPARSAEGRPASCQADPQCPENRRLRNLRQREAAKNGDMAFDPIKHQSNRLLPPAADGHAQAVPAKPNFWQDKRRQEQQQNQSE
ncbi:hypothetical protein KIF53_00210 [Chromobacterium subtsugae]|uniref:Uncharacterized protein n=1 Tax=Chromobacterium subtsugae TaxID=251747 RepID=A0ABS7F7I2_9NEIS|nr:MULTISPECIES: hypothetical protein [Chromobacterium]KUM02221.1 hypothetical protein Cv017_04390 [Chromobacterium subtsugae]KZE86138.1 hypothetical protein AWB61_16480 [Chromobacterium sp. F49]MBW7568854.1 hypothetical protein [Chromobacterium subtsugae]MBW8286055.1 hypothetical protein [Chromobacterium subtsugae]OBU86319.1 hypothetical protein MY55_11730 [Chromobacterium subtsugae]